MVAGIAAAAAPSPAPTRVDHVRSVLQASPDCASTRRDDRHASNRKNPKTSIRHGCSGCATTAVRMHVRAPATRRNNCMNPPRVGGERPKSSRTSDIGRRASARTQSQADRDEAKRRGANVLVAGFRKDDQVREWRFESEAGVDTVLATRLVGQQKAKIVSRDQVLMQPTTVPATSMLTSANRGRRIVLPC